MYVYAGTYNCVLIVSNEEVALFSEAGLIRGPKKYKDSAHLVSYRENGQNGKKA